MRSGSNPQKVQQWTERFLRFENSSQSVSEFCLGEGVSQPSFYQWRKKLRLSEHLAGTGKSAKGRSTNFRPVSLIESPTVQLPKLRFPGGVELELGNDAQLAQSIVKQLIESTVSGLELPSC